MKLEERDIDLLVRNELGALTNGVTFNYSSVYISLNHPDGYKNSIEGEWRHMSDSETLMARIKMLQHAIYEQYPEYVCDLPRKWAR
ncbi:TPA: hypothetical protein ACSP8C_002243 [Aeromonas veronii]